MSSSSAYRFVLVTLSSFFVIALVVSIVGISSTNSTEQESTATVEATVVSVYDGDTLTVVLSDGRTERVRLIGIDTPEIEETPYGDLARDFTVELVAGRTVWLVYDPQHPNDKYERLLVYAWLLEPPQDQTLAETRILTDTLNGRLVTEGYATAMTIEPHTTYANSFERAAKAAEEGRLGLWPLGAFS